MIKPALKIEPDFPEKCMQHSLKLRLFFRYRKRHDVSPEEELSEITA